MSIENVGNTNRLLNNAHEWVEKPGFQKIKNAAMPIHADSDQVQMERPNKSFGDLLLDAINDVNSLQKKADVEIQKLVSGKSKNIHQTMLAVEKADIAFRTMNQLRLKVIESYREILKMQI